MQHAMQDQIRRLQALAETRQDELWTLLERLVAYPTVSPPARNTGQAQQYVASYLQACGFEASVWDVYPGDPNVTALKRGADSANYRSLLLNGHIDVAEVGDHAQWERDPFRLAHENGRVYGRGVSDMKGGLAALLFALKLLHEENIELQGDLLMQSVIGEEAGEAGTRACIERGCEADFAIVADTSSLAIQGQGGVITGWITIQHPETQHDGMRARLLREDGNAQGISAIEKMMKLVAGLQELERRWSVEKAYPGFPPGSTTINPAVIEGGRHAAFIADRCALWITVHFYPDEDYEAVAREIEEHLMRITSADPWLRQHPPTFRWGGRSMIEERGEIFPSLALDRTEAGLLQLARSHYALLGAEPQIDMSPTVTDAGWIARAGIPTVIYGPGELRHAHAVNESADKQELLAYVQIMIAFICEWCSTSRPEAPVNHLVEEGREKH
ncbi:acetylornithine deacetylase [Paenibacillus sp. HB172176]|uniref:acetylornithine deacetylase n=1 Tax=Paenibacillus sp. HB172176 TaxID=2493690 RepID=UPI0023F7992C|nr:acetylornithine deacetylase [Paenibacillus sp. HB172176]